MTLLDLDHVASLPDVEPQKKGLWTRIYDAMCRARMAQAERMIDQYRELLGDIDEYRLLVREREKAASGRALTGGG